MGGGGGGVERGGGRGRGEATGIEGKGEEETQTHIAQGKHGEPVEGLKPEPFNPR